MRPPAENRACCLYRHYDRAWRLLYVGISLSHGNRLRRHQELSRWFDQIALITIEHFPTKATALSAEAHAIAKEDPLFNFQRTGEDLKYLSTSLTDRQWSLVDAAVRGSGLSMAEVLRRVLDLEQAEGLLRKMARKSAAA